MVPLTYRANYKVRTGKASERKMSISQQQSPVSPKRSLDYATGPRGTPARPNLARPTLPRRRTAPNSGLQERHRKAPSDVVLKRLKKDNEGWGSSQGTTQQTTLGERSCESCKARRLRCHGEKPSCRHCRELGIECQYKIGKRDKTQR